MKDKTKNNIVFTIIGTILFIVIKYFNLNFWSAMLLAVVVSGVSGYLVRKNNK